jgi:glucokinase
VLAVGKNFFRITETAARRFRLHFCGQTFFHLATTGDMRRNSVQTSDLESDILKNVRAADGISRVELARALGLAPSTAGIYVERLIKEGFLEETTKAERDTGRPPMLLRLNAEGGEFVGVDFEARDIRSVAVDFSDKPLRNAQAAIGPDDSIDTVLRKLEQTIAKVLPRDPKRLLALGVGVPGLVNSKEGIALHYKYIANWKNVPLAERLAKKFGVPVYLENNVRSMALAELWFGQGLGMDDFICVGIRSGIGAGMVLDGRLYCGASHDAGEFGRWRCPPLGGKGAAWFETGAARSPLGPELQEVASVRALQRALQRALGAGQKSVLKGRPFPISPGDMLEALQQRDRMIALIVGEAARCLGWAIGHLSLVIDPQKIILAGPLTLLGDAMLQPLRETTESIVALSDSRMPEIVNSTMGEFSGALGAAALALHEWKPAR